MKRKTKIPENFQVTDEVRDYASRKWGLLYLPDVMLADFQHCFDEELGGNGYRHKNWDATFKRYIRESSPSGTFHKPWIWESRCEQARRYKGGAAGPRDSVQEQVAGEQRQPGVVDRRARHSTWMPASPEVHRERMRHVREILGK